MHLLKVMACNKIVNLGFCLACSSWGHTEYFTSLYLVGVLFFVCMQTIFCTVLLCLAWYMFCFSLAFFISTIIWLIPKILCVEAKNI